MYKADMKIANNILKKIPGRLQCQVQCTNVRQWMKPIMCMVDRHDIESNFLEATAQHSSSCTNFNNQWFNLGLSMHRHNRLFSRWPICRLGDARRLEGCTKLICKFTASLFQVTKSGCSFAHWTVLICMIRLVTSTITTNVESLSASSLGHRQGALVQIVIKTYGIAITCPRNSSLQALRHLDGQ